MGKDWSKGLEFVPRRACVTCGGVFYAPPVQIRRGGGKYCGRKCYGEARKKQIKTRTCRKCGDLFHKYGGRIGNCCDSCKRPAPHLSPDLTACINCGEDSKAKFCNRGCYTQHRISKLKPKKLPPQNSTCLSCRAGFYASPGHVKNGWGKYCSMRCRPLPKYSSGRGGTRKDLGIYVRSSWEANYARYLNWLVSQGSIKKWEYEPDLFEFEEIKRGTRFYTPDFKVYENNGDIIYHEVKGYMDKTSATKLKRMAKYHPKVKIVLIMKKEMLEIKAKVGGLINWETNTNQKL